MLHTEQYCLQPEAIELGQYQHMTVSALPPTLRLIHPKLRRCSPESHLMWLLLEQYGTCVSSARVMCYWGRRLSHAPEGCILSPG